MRKNEAIRNSTEATPERYAAGAPEKDSSAKGTGPNASGKEKRVPLDVQAYLGTYEQLLAAERAITVNVSPRGARAITRRRLVGRRAAVARGVVERVSPASESDLLAGSDDRVFLRGIKI